MADLIDRQAAIKAIAAYMPSLTTADGSVPVDHDIFVAQEACVDCIQIIHELPPAQPEQKVGKWIVDGHHLRCSACGVYMCSEDREGDRIALHFCPNCGAKMEEQDG